MNTRKFVTDILDHVRIALDTSRSADWNQSAGSGRPASFPYMDPPQHQRGDSASNTEGLFQSTISDAERAEMVKRCGPAQAICYGFCADALDQGFNILDSQENDITDRFRPVYTELVRAPLLAALQSARVYGYSGLLAVYSRGKGFEDPLKGNEADIASFVPIPKTWIKEIQVEKDGQGRILIPHKMLGYEMALDCSIQRIDVSRLEHIQEPSSDPDKPFEGASALDVAFDGLTVWKHVLWGLGQCFWRSGNGLLSVNGPEGAEDWQLNRIDDVLRNISATTAFALPYGCEVKKHATDALSPKEYEEAALDEVASASRIPRKVLLGVEKGAIAGSVTDMALYISTLSSYQSAVVEPALRDVLKRLQATGQIEYSGEFEIDWVTPETLGERQKAEVEVMKARAEFLIAQTEAREFGNAGAGSGSGSEGEEYGKEEGEGEGEGKQ